MPFDGTPPIPDLSVPSLENLAYMLRHRETWPEGFRWSYRNYNTCALGLADQMWSDGWRQRFSLPYDITCAAWLLIPPGWAVRRYVAFRIERLLVRQ